MRTPADLGEWSLHCFCLEARSTPHGVVRADDNGRLLLAARDPTTIGRLRASGIACTESQLRLLEIYGLIRRAGDDVQASFPILDADSTRQLRGRLGAIAGATRKQLNAAAETIVLCLREDGLDGGAFAVIFGHALDGLFWDELRWRDMLPATGLSLEHPFWRGAFWASYPKRQFAAGTNEERVEGAALVMVWTDETAAALAALARTRSTRPWIEALAAAPGDPLLQRRPGGRRPIPVLRAGEADRLSRACGALAEQVARLVPELPACAELLRDTGVVADAREAAVIIGHEIIWAVADRMMADDVFGLPSPDDIDAHLLVRLG